MFDDDNEERKPDPDCADKVRVALGKIQESFGSLKYPGEKAIKDGSFNIDIAEMVAEFGHRHWTELTPDRLFFHREVLSVLGPDGLLYYLPAYMRAALGSASRDGETRLYTMYALRPIGKSATDRARYIRRISLLDDAQKDAVRAFLRAVAAEHGACERDPAMKEWGIQ
jgi:hypothetical protein